MTAQEHFNAAMEDYRIGDMVEYLDEVKNAFLMDMENETYGIQYGYAMSEFEGIISDIQKQEKKILIEPNDAYKNYRLGSTLILVGRLSKAIEYLNKAIELDTTPKLHITKSAKKKLIKIENKKKQRENN